MTANAKSLFTRGGKLVLLSPKPQVKEMLDITGISLTIPICLDMESAQATLGV